MLLQITAERLPRPATAPSLVCSNKVYGLTGAVAGEWPQWRLMYLYGREMDPPTVLQGGESGSANQAYKGGPHKAGRGAINDLINTLSFSTYSFVLGSVWLRPNRMAWFNMSRPRSCIGRQSLHNCDIAGKPVFRR